LSQDLVRKVCNFSGSCSQRMKINPLGGLGCKNLRLAEQDLMSGERV
jgi:hypothetical protein